ncbi:hypothetical protein C665_18607 [Thauera aminoaromatica S2]|uniref:Uncharacterized protein n=2 Tax=Thauera aminoaromatica TaxID=164330 RepID=N6X982_THASP|nr:hypothetical protein C665_18607 [Thauera aminoaromatica S2]
MVAEACLLLARAGFDPARALMLLERSAVHIALSLESQTAPVRTLFERDDNVPASLADACLLRMSELFEPCSILTLGRNFGIYRRLGRKTISLMSPCAQVRTD